MRKLNRNIRFIMQPKHIALQAEYQSARDTYYTKRQALLTELAQAKAEFAPIKHAYNLQIKHLNATLEPERDRVEDYISKLTPHYLLSTPKSQVYSDMKRICRVNIGVIKFGRIMSENGYSITTRGGKTPLVRHWRYRD